MCVCLSLSQVGNPQATRAVEDLHQYLRRTEVSGLGSNDNLRAATVDWVHAEADYRKWRAREAAGMGEGGSAAEVGGFEGGQVLLEALFGAAAPAPAPAAAVVAPIVPVAPGPGSAGSGSGAEAAAKAEAERREQCLQQEREQHKQQLLQVQTEMQQKMEQKMQQQEQKMEQMQQMVQQILLQQSSQPMEVVATPVHVPAPTSATAASGDDGGHGHG